MIIDTRWAVSKSGQYLSVLCYVCLLVLYPGTAFGGPQKLNTSRTGKNQVVPYTVLHDDMGNMISVGVQADITELQLRATLARVADEHQNDAARDYVGFYLWVKAYLLVDGHPSNVSAGSIRRFIPLKNPAERKKLTANRRRSDSFEITLAAARQSLR